MIAAIRGADSCSPLLSIIFCSPYLVVYERCGMQKYSIRRREKDVFILKFLTNIKEDKRSEDMWISWQGKQSKETCRKFPGYDEKVCKKQKMEIPDVGKLTLLSWSERNSRGIVYKHECDCMVLKHYHWIKRQHRLSLMMSWIMTSIRVQNTKQYPNSVAMLVLLYWLISFFLIFVARETGYGLSKKN